MGKKLLIYTEGGLKLGLGNIYRCLSLAKALRAGYAGVEISFISSSPKDVASIITGNGFKVDVTEESLLSERIVSHNPDCVIIDVLGIGENFTKALKDNGIKVVIIGNNTTANHFADIVVNAIINTGLKNRSFKDEYGTLNLWGPKYLVLRDEFERLRDSYRYKGKPEKIVLLFGGSDQSDFTSKTAVALSGKGYNLSIIVGKAYEHYEEMLRIAEASEDIKLFRNISNVSEIYKDADFLFTSPGTALFEGLCIGIPALSFYQNQSQIDVFGNFFTCNSFDTAADPGKMMAEVYGNYPAFKAERDFYGIGTGRREIIDSIATLINQAR